MVNGTETREKSLMTEKVLITNITAQIILTLTSITMTLNAEHH